MRCVHNVDLKLCKEPHGPEKTEIERAEAAANRTLNGWIDALMPKFNPIEIMALKQRMVAVFREYETKIQTLEAREGIAIEGLERIGAECLLAGTSVGDLSDLANETLISLGVFK